MSEKFIYEKEVTGDNKLEAALRESVNNWANSIPHHPFRNLGDKIKVNSIWYKPAYPINLRSQYEERSKYKDHEPYTNQNIPPRTIYELSDFNSWDRQLSDINDFEDSTTSFYVDGSQHVEDCQHCKATGRVTCHRCNGKRTIDCPVCHGTRKVDCGPCHGSGDVYCDNCKGNRYVTKQVAKTRSIKRGSGDNTWWDSETYYEPVRESCRSCGGSGTTSCYPCNGSGKVTCDRCKGRGIIDCPLCKGIGNLQCPICKGATQLMHYFYIKRELEYTEKGTCVINGDVYDNFPEFLEEFPEYESKVVYTTKEMRISQNQLPEDHHLNSYINKFLDETQADNTDSHIMQFQQLDISCIDTWELHYTFRGKKYVMAFTGTQFEIIPGLSPVYEIAYEYWEKGVSAGRKFLYSRASKLLTKSWMIDVYEIKDQVNQARWAVEEKIHQSYGLGSMIAFLITAFLGAFLSYTYYSEVNYVFGYMDFINNPDNFLYDYHAWAQTIFSVYIIYLAYVSGKYTGMVIGNNLPTVLIRVITGIVLTLFYSALYLTIWGLLNAVGISIIITFLIWILWKVIWIIWWIIKIVVIAVVWVAMIIWYIIEWIWGLFT